MQTFYKDQLRPPSSISVRGQFNLNTKENSTKDFNLHNHRII
jgi:hypothetical protein